MPSLIARTLGDMTANPSRGPSLMTYEHQEDIDPDKEVSLLELDDEMRAAVHRTASNVAETTKIADGPRRLIAELLRSFLPTHGSIRLILAKAQEDIKLAPDAASLVREQVEKVFTVTLLVDDPEKWISVYDKDGWRRVYQYFLLERQEGKNLAQRQEFFHVIGPQQMEEGRQLFNISKEGMEIVEHRFLHPGKPLPSHLRGHKIPTFPTPGTVKREVGAEKAAILERWHREYVRLCGYSHIGFQKLVLAQMDSRGASFSEEQKKEYFEKEILLLFSLSYIAAAAACTEVEPILYELDIDKLAKLTTFWESLRESSLPGKVFYELHAKKQFELGKSQTP